MRCLIVEDDFTSRLLLQRLLAVYGECDVAVHGIEALEAFDLAHKEGQPYDLICLDVMMPEMDGRHVLEYVRSREKSLGVAPRREVRIIMTTALNTPKEVVGAYKDGCTSYLVKPIARSALLAELRNVGLIA